MTDADLKFFVYVLCTYTNIPTKIILDLVFKIVECSSDINSYRFYSDLLKALRQITDNTNLNKE